MEICTYIICYCRMCYLLEFIARLESVLGIKKKRSIVALTRGCVRPDKGKTFIFGNNPRISLQLFRIRESAVSFLYRTKRGNTPETNPAANPPRSFSSSCSVENAESAFRTLRLGFFHKTKATEVGIVLPGLADTVMEETSEIPAWLGLSEMFSGVKEK